MTDTVFGTLIKLVLMALSLGSVAWCSNVMIVHAGMLPADPAGQARVANDAILGLGTIFALWMVVILIGSVLYMAFGRKQEAK